MAFAGALVYGTPILLQSILAPSWGAGPGQLGILLCLNLLGGAAGARWNALPGWLAAGILAIALLSPWPNRALVTESAIPACALVFACGFLSGRWTVSLLSVPAGKRHLWYALETTGGALAILSLLVWGMASFDLPALCRLAGLLAMVGGAFSFGLVPGREAGSDKTNPTPRRIPELLLAAWSGFQFFHSQIAWTHHFAQSHPNSTTAFGIVSLSMVAGVPLGAIAARKCPSIRMVALLSLGGTLLLPAAQTSVLRSFGTTMARADFPWDLLGASLLAIVPAAAASALLFPWLLSRWERSDRLGELVAANLAGGLAGALVAGWITLPMAGLHAGVWIVSLGWCVVAVVPAAPKGARWAAGAGALGMSILGWNLWDGPLAPRPDYQVLDRLDGWSGRVELVEREGHRFLLYNGSYALGGTRSVVSHARQAQVAMALRPHARDVFVLGLGTGVTAGALTGSVELRRARVVELLPQVERMARIHFASWTGTLFSDPRFSIEVGDARTALGRDTGRYDLVLGDLFLPWLPGAELLVCREHFQSVRDHLRPDGLFVQWFPLYQLTEPVFMDVLATAESVFGEVHLFRESQNPDGPLVALVAVAPGGSLSAPGGSPEILRLWSGSTAGMPFLDGIPATTAANRLERMLSSGGLYPAQPTVGQAISGPRWSGWMERAITARPLDELDAFRGFGPEAWKQVAYGFLQSREIALRNAGDAALADSAASLAKSLLEK